MKITATHLTDSEGESMSEDKSTSSTTDNVESAVEKKRKRKTRIVVTKVSPGIEHLVTQ